MNLEDLSCKNYNDLRPVSLGTRHYPEQCTPCAESLDELECTQIKKQTYALRLTDFIPLIGLSNYFARTDIDNDNPISDRFDRALGAAMLGVYNLGVGTGLYYLWDKLQ